MTESIASQDPGIQSGRIGLNITPASQEQLGLVLEILEEAAHWTTSHGLNGWQPGSFSHERIIRQIGHGEVFLAWLSSEPIGTITLQGNDIEFWGDGPETAEYVHKLAVKRKFAGRGFGVEMLMWAESHAIIARKDHLRLNCMAEDTGLRRYYERLGFEQRGEIIEPRGRAALYEKKLNRSD